MNEKELELYDVYSFDDNEPCELIQAEHNIEVNEYGYKLMGHLYKNMNNCLVFFENRMIKMTPEQFSNFSRERKLKTLL